MIFTGIVLYATIGCLLVAVGYPADTWQFWCFLATYWAVAKIARTQGRVEGIVNYIDMTVTEQQRLKDKLRAVREASK